MDRNDQQAIQGLFQKLSQVERQSPERDGEADAYIREQIAHQPGAPYYMAQTIVVQEQELNAAQARIEEMEQELASRPASGGGLFSGLFGGGGRPSRPSGAVPLTGGSEAMGQQPFQQQGYPQRTGGGFLAGAAQTAMGVAGGMLLGNMVAGMLGGGEAKAAEPQAEEPKAENANYEDDEQDQGGFDDLEI
ncbi:hypothetical protein GCM10011491_38430 [Brucella endophytica]|uniref:DUF2076 domain-containing protein n=1 Tax=Brucella endophytica TaxID=1963359 RepID=A0A916SLY3_9HYPH|nr:DUF2076 domain-containing protein [Brucella endophytica]GGB06609.1 hypothetical protein GCM10011491_38430 [Brucella endophytica]